MRAQLVLMGLMTIVISACFEKEAPRGGTAHQDHGKVLGSEFSQQSEKKKTVTTMAAIRLDTEGKGYKNLLREGENSRVLHSGLVELAPSESVGEHNSEQYEEIIIPISGKGQIFSPNGDTLEVTPDNAIYCLPWTVHNVKNTGDTPLKYVYTVAKTGEKPDDTPK